MMGPTTVFFKNPENHSMDTSERIAKVEIQVESLKEDVKELKDDVKELHSRITTGNREILDKIDAMEGRMEKRMKDSADVAAIQHNQIETEVRRDVQTIADKVNVLERWRWMIFGGAIVLGYLISHLDIFSKVFNAK